MQDLPLIREVHGFRRTECGCAFCSVYCRHMPGTLDPADLIPLCGDQQDVLIWAEQHLRALVEQPYPTLVPARNHQGHCHWYFDGKCAVHKDARRGYYHASCDRGGMIWRRVAFVTILIG